MSQSRLSDQATGCCSSFLYLFRDDNMYRGSRRKEQVFRAKRRNTHTVATTSFISVFIFVTQAHTHRSINDDALVEDKSKVQGSLRRLFCPEQLEGLSADEDGWKDIFHIFQLASVQPIFFFLSLFLIFLYDAGKRAKNELQHRQLSNLKND